MGVIFLRQLSLIEDRLKVWEDKKLTSCPFIVIAFTPYFAPCSETASIPIAVIKIDLCNCARKRWSI